MSAGGLIAQAVLGGAAEVGQGIGDRIREEAKLKRQQALAKTNTTEIMKRQAHDEALTRGTNEQQHGMTLEQQKAKDQQARGRIKLTDELGQENYSDVTDENGNIIGQRETGSNQYTPYTTSGKGSDRFELAVESLNGDIEAIYKSAEAMGGQMTPEMQGRLDVLTAQRNAMLYGNGENSTLLTELLSGEGGGQAPADSQAEPEAKEPGSLRGLVGNAMSAGKKQEKTQDVQAQIDSLEEEADRMLNRLAPGPTWKAGSGGKPSYQKPSQPSDEDLAAAQDLVQRLIALDENPETAKALTPRQRQNIVERIMDLQKAGVPINLK